MASRFHLGRASVWALAVLALCAGSAADAQTRSLQPSANMDPTVPAGEVPQALEEVTFSQRLGESLPAAATFTTSNEESLRLGSLLGERPLVVVPVYYDCPMLCSMVLSGVMTTVKGLGLNLGEDYELVVFTIDENETPEMAAAQKGAFLRRIGLDGEHPGAHFLTGKKQDIEALADAIGFEYEFQPDTGEFAHTAGLVIASPEGVISRYFFGISYPDRDVRLALVEAADGKIGSAVDQVLLFCFRYDPTTGRYSALALNIIKLGGILTVAGLVLMIGLQIRRDRNRNQSLGTMQNA